MRRWEMMRYKTFIIVTILCVTVLGMIGILPKPAVVQAAANLDIGPAELLYTDAEMPFTYDGSMATLKKDATNYYFFHTQGGFTRKWYGPLDDPLQNFVGTMSVDQNGFVGQIWLVNIYKHTDGTLIGFAHREDRTVNPFLYYIGLFKSTDNGNSWFYLGDVIAPKDKTKNVGGVPYLVVGEYFYVYFNEFATSSDRRQAVARAKVSDVMAAAANNTVTPFKKYNNGSWTEDGLTGTASNIMPVIYDFHSDAAYNRSLGVYMLTAWTRDDLSLFTSTDGINWGNKTIIHNTTGQLMLPYSTFAALSDTTDDNREVGDDFYIYIDQKVSPQSYSDDTMYRRHITVDEVQPGIPSGLSANAGNGQVTLNWNSASAADGYKVKYGTTSGSYPNVIDVGDTTTAVIDGLTNGTTYYFVVTAYNQNGESANSNEISASPIGTVSNLAPSATLSVDSTNGAYTKDKAVDGTKDDASSRWISGNSSEPHWFELDWASNQTINNVKVWSGHPNPGSTGWQIYDFTIQYWDGNSWVTVATVDNNMKDSANGQFNDLSFTPVTTNKLRMHITDGTNKAGYTDARLIEIEVWGTGAATLSNLAPSATLSVDSTNGAYTKDKAVDGTKDDASSRWISGNSSEPHWFELDWASNQTINNVKVWSGHPNPGSTGWQIYDFTIQYWDGNSWVTVATVDNNMKDSANGQFNDLSFTPVTTNKLRMHITDGTNKAGYTDARLIEIEVWGY